MVNVRRADALLPFRERQRSAIMLWLPAIGFPRAAFLLIVSPELRELGQQIYNSCPMSCSIYSGSASPTLAHALVRTPVVIKLDINPDQKALVGIGGSEEYMIRRLRQILQSNTSPISDRRDVQLYLEFSSAILPASSTLHTWIADILADELHVLRYRWI